jgi:hypothetical protein
MLFVAASDASTAIIEDDEDHDEDDTMEAADILKQKVAPSPTDSTESLASQCFKGEYFLRLTVLDGKINDPVGQRPAVFVIC